MSTVILVVGCLVVGAAILVAAFGWLMRAASFALSAFDPDQEGL